MKRVLSSAAAVAAIFLVFGCSTPYKVAGPADQQKLAEQEKGSTDRTDADKQGRRPETISERDMTSAREAETQQRLRELQQKVQDIYFDYDSYDISDDAKPVLKGLADMLARTKGIKVVLEGHCDERGTNEYNLALGERRANAAREFLVSLGTPSKRIETISYGEEKPACTESTEACWAKNRRVHIVLVEEMR
ncbi:MAG TPA: peptidoglycan-associated lipoprotein Pal [Dissulfurispiraceae bacterium]|nr:peptidoglycan-associated lipoprotein Pal [Dissulfurispiraceae bacterium]